MIRGFGRSVVTVFLAATAGQGCNDASGPGGLAGSYTLERIAGPHLVGEAISGGLALARPYSSRPASIYKRRD